MDKISKEKIDIFEFIEENTDIIYSMIFYIAGILAGTLLYKNLDFSRFSDILKSFFVPDTSSFLSVFIEKLAIYITIYVITILMGLCIIGFPIMNAIPLLCGFEIAIKLSYYYNLYNLKGIGYSILMIIPQAAAFITVLFFTMQQARSLSKTIFDTAIQKENRSEIILANYFKRFLIYALIVIAITILNSLLIYLFNSIISI